MMSSLIQTQALFENSTHTAKPVPHLYLFL